MIKIIPPRYCNLLYEL